MQFKLATIAVLLGLGAYAVIAKLRGRSGAETEPWQTGESIYDFIERNIDPRSGAMHDSAMPLPDEARRYKPGEARPAAGERDGASGHHAAGAAAERKATQAVALLTRIAHKRSTAPRRELYSLLQDDTVLEFLDATLRKLAGQSVLRTENVRAFARSLATTAPDRGPVKLAIALLGVIRNRGDVEIVADLGRHEEFTLYSAVALTNALPHPDDELFELAQSVFGWGRIQTVERLAETANPKIKQWLLREGFRNSVGNERLALVCAEAGELHDALAPLSVDREVLDAATDLIVALLRRGSSGSFDDYTHAAAAATNYLRHIGAAPLQLRHFLAVRGLHDYLTAKDWDATARQKNGWNPASRENVMTDASTYLRRPDWADLVRRQLASNAPDAFEEASSAAEILGLELWPIHWDRLMAAPDDPMRWNHVMSVVDHDRIDQVVALAEAKLPLDEIASGPTQSLGSGAELQAHRALDFILQGLDRYAGHGKKILVAGLRSPVARNRLLAAKALGAWGLAERDADIASALERARKDELDPDLQQRIERVIAGQPLE